MNIQWCYLTLEHVIELHDYAVTHSGGLQGVKDIGTLESILCHVQNDDYYPAFEDKVCHLFYAINKSHAFNDGNKRACITSTAYFLELNGYGALASRFIRSFENIAVYVAENRIDRNLLLQMITEFLYEDDFSESIKLRLLHVMTI